MAREIIHQNSLPSPSMSPQQPESPMLKNTHPSPSASDDTQPRKRSRTDLSVDERKEARAHRNRIAAQNSRDRRKAQFNALEQRIVELEAENRTLRASMGLAALRDSDEHRAIENQRERENAELRERVKTLEQGWDAILKAVQLTGIPAGILPQPVSASASPPAPAPASSTNARPSSSKTSASKPHAHHAPATFPVFVPPSPVFPLSPAPSSASTASQQQQQPLFLPDSEPEPTRHLARVASTAKAVPQQRDAQHPQLDDAAMDDLFREILASPTLSAAVPPQASSSAFAPLADLDYEEGAAGLDVGMAGEDSDDALADQEAEVNVEQLQALWEWLPGSTAADDLSALELDVGVGATGWDMPVVPPVSVAEVF
ncbi:unnamed protein product [Peniophora sp. CBMAI 1063]|nr:unnamed protein product [Peniophora sp. CBMAI 1063]